MLGTIHIRCPQRVGERGTPKTNESTECKRDKRVKNTKVLLTSDVSGPLVALKSRSAHRTVIRERERERE